MGASKSSRILKRRSSKEKRNETNVSASRPEDVIEKNKENLLESDKASSTNSSSDQSLSDSQKGNKKKASKKFQKKRNTTYGEHIFSNKSISNLSRSLGPNDWIKLSYALGFLPQGIAHFTGRASSAQNSYSQCTMMLKTWRELTPKNEILPRLCDALRRIRRNDLAVKMGLELAICADQDDANNNDSDMLLDLIKSGNEKIPPFDESKEIFGDKNVSFLARQILAREEWKRLAYALGFYPDDASQIIASASSSQNLYAQAHLMLMKWRDRISPADLVPQLRAAFVRIRRHDLVFLLDLGIIAGPKEIQAQSLVKLKKIFDQVKKSNYGNMGHLELKKFSAFQNY